MPAAVAPEQRRAARAAGLIYVQDDQPGYRRERRGRGFRYMNPRGQPVRQASLVRRFEALAIPPAWTSVWICARDNGHLQATGYDARGRKQYRYHAAWRANRDADKFRLAQFAARLPALRRRVQRILHRRGLPREKVLAAMLRLLDSAALRVGNREYAESNRSFGLTTLEDRHVRRSGGTLELRYRGKGGIPHRVEIDDPRLARIIRRCSDLPGQRLFQYLDDDDVEHPIGSSEVNATIQEWTGSDFTAKDFRTWAGSVAFLQAVRDNPAGVPQMLNDVVSQVAVALGNTPAICRRHYIHPLLIEQWTDGRLQGTAHRRIRITEPRGLSATERLLLRELTRPNRGGSRRVTARG